MEQEAKGQERSNSYMVSIASLGLSALIAAGVGTFISSNYLPNAFFQRKPIQGEIVRDTSSSGKTRYCLFYNGLSFELREGYTSGGGIDDILSDHGQTPTTNKREAFMLVHQNREKLPRQRDEGKKFKLEADPHKSIRAGKTWIPILSREC